MSIDAASAQGLPARIADRRLNRLMLRVAAALLWALSLSASADAQLNNPQAFGGGLSGTVPRLPPPVESGKGTLYLSATFASEGQPIKAGLLWRVFNARADNDAGTRDLVAESREPTPTLNLADGEYIVHVSYGLAGATRHIVINGQATSERVMLNAGALQIVGTIGDSPIPQNRLMISVYVPERSNSEAKLVLANARTNDIIGLPEGNYHIVSTYLDTVGAGSTNPDAPAGNASNSVVSADIRVQAGKLVVATMRHRAATLTLKLVNKPGGEALANTNFTILTPGGDVIRELIGAFPSMVLAEGEYVAIARNNGKTYQSVFKVQSALDSDVEVVAKSSE
jgi:hypothetical protein